jgi:hypothetical protein
VCFAPPFSPLGLAGCIRALKAKARHDANRRDLFHHEASLSQWSRGTFVVIARDEAAAAAHFHPHLRV